MYHGESRTEPTQELARVIVTTSNQLAQLCAGGEDVKMAELPMQVLQRVLAGPGITVAELAKLLEKYPSNISIAVRDLITRGLIERVKDGTDKRLARLYPSAKARERVEQLYVSWDTVINRAMLALPKSEANRLLAAIPALSRLSVVLDTLVAHETETRRQSSVTDTPA